VDNPLVRTDSLKTQLQRALRDRILSGHYAPGSQFPSEVELVDEFGVSRTTVRSSLAALEAEGLIQRRWGVGTFVSRQHRISHQIEEALDFTVLISSSGYTPGVQVLSATASVAGVLECERLDVAEGSDILRVAKVFTADEAPVIYVVNLIPHRILGDGLFSEVQRRPELTEPIYTFLEETCGHRVDYHVATLAAILAQDAEIVIPDIDPVTPLLTMSSIGHDREGRPVFESRSTYPDPRLQMKLLRRRS
jgi:GntR family transcriptional regulator